MRSMLWWGTSVTEARSSGLTIAISRILDAESTVEAADKTARRTSATVLNLLDLWRNFPASNIHSIMTKSDQTSTLCVWSPFWNNSSSAGETFPSDKQTIRPPLGQSAYCYYKRFGTLQGRRRRNLQAIGEEAGRRHHHLRFSVYAGRCRAAHHLQLRAGTHWQRAQRESHASAVSSTRGYFSIWKGEVPWISGVWVFAISSSRAEWPEWRSIPVA